MSRVVLPAVCLVLALAVGAGIRGQIVPLPSESIGDYGWPPSPLLAKDTARAKFALSLASPAELKQARFEAAEMEFEGRFKEFLSGRGTLDFLLDTSRRRLEAHLAITASDAEKLIAYDTHWTLLKEIEAVNQARFTAGRIPVQDLMQTRYYRLEAELWLVEAQARKDKK